MPSGASKGLSYRILTSRVLIHRLGPGIHPERSRAPKYCEALDPDQMSREALEGLHPS